jgi:4-hydroxybenzoate polyprenyltransferase
LTAAIVIADPAAMATTIRPTRRAILRGYLALPHDAPILIVLAATAAFAFVAKRGWPGAGDLACLLGAMLGGQLAVGAVNELVDADLDAVAKPDKPIAAGLVSKTGAWAVAIVGLVLMAVFSFRFSLGAFGLCALGTGAGIAYSLWFKRTIWSWVPYLIALPLLPIWVWSALESVPAGLFAIYPIGAAAVVAVQIAQSLPDLAVDSASGVRTLAVALGPERAHLACWSAMLLAALLAAGFAPWLTGAARFVWIAAAISAALVAIDAAIWRRNVRSGALACFPCVALGAAALGVGWAAALVR